MKKISPLFLLVFVFILLSCGNRREIFQETRPASQVFPEAVKESDLSALVTLHLQPTQGNNISGTVVFTPIEKGGVRVTADITGLTPGDHGFHVHEKGDCSAPDASSAGEHFNPTAMPHAGPDAPQHHAGDLGNLTADASGAAHLDRIYTFLSLEGPNGILGRSVIIHAGNDDLISEPAGNSGARVACGVIR